MSEEVRITLVNNLTPNDYIKVSDDFYKLGKKCIKLNNIIKEAREYIKDNVVVYAFNNKDLPHWEFNDDNVKELLEILDKINKE